MHFVQTQKKIQEAEDQLRALSGRLYLLRHERSPLSYTTTTIGYTTHYQATTQTHVALSSDQEKPILAQRPDGNPFLTQDNHPTQVQVAPSGISTGSEEKNIEEKMALLQEKLKKLQNNGVAVLMLTNTMKKSGSGVNTSLGAAVGEIKSETLKLAQSTNNQLSEHGSNQNKAVKGVKYAVNTVIGPLGKITGLEFDLQSAIKNMMETNPIAVSQVLIQHPEFANEVCIVSQQMEADHERDGNRRTALKAVTWGGMIIGSVAMASGYFSAPGAVLVEASEAGAATLAATELATSTTATLSTVSSVMNMSAMAGNLTYVAKDYVTLDRVVASGHAGHLAGTNDGKKVEEDQEKLEQASKEMLSSVGNIVAFSALGYGVGQIAKWAQFSENAPQFLKNLSGILKAIQTNKQAALVLESIDKVCMAMGEVKCNLLTSALHAKAMKDPKGFQSLMDHKNEFDSFVKEVWIKKFNQTVEEKAVPMGDPKKFHLESGAAVSVGFKGKVIYIDDLADYLPESQHLREPNGDFTKKTILLQDMPKVNATVSDTMFSNRTGKNGKEGLVRLGWLKDGTPIAIKTIHPADWGWVEGPYAIQSPGTKRMVDLFLTKQANGLKQASDLGGSMKFYGIVIDPVTGEPGIATSIIQGGGPVNTTTLHDTYQTLVRMREKGYTGFGFDIVTDRKGNLATPDFEDMTFAEKAVDGTSEPYTKVQIEVLDQVKLEDGIAFLQDLRKKDPAFWEALKKQVPPEITDPNKKPLPFDQYRNYFNEEK